MASGIYIHIPFCRSRCSYCDFATDVYKSWDAVDRYVAALCTEISSFEQSVDTADTIYLGGGTPSLLTPGQLERILAAVHDRFPVSLAAEVTMEMNPSTVTPESLAGFRHCGVNRASYGVQTFNDRSLKLLARGHDANDARLTFAMLREAGFDNISFDLIGGLPGQSLLDWETNVKEAIRLAPEHLSLYLLEIHEGTPLAAQLNSGRQPVPDDELAAAMYELMLDELLAAGYVQYEISNFSRPGRESRHNSKYWTLDPVLGFGVSAHSFDGKQRYANERDTAKYVEMIEAGGSAEVMREDTDLSSEFIFLGLRMETGINLADHEQRFCVDLMRKYEDGIASITEAELIHVSDGFMRLTRKGKLFSNEVFAVFV